MTAERFRGAVRMAAGVVFALSFAAVASAQTGQIRGKVLDAQGQPVPDAKIVIDFKGNITRVNETKTDKRGTYIQVGLQIGPYEVTASKGELTQTLKATVNAGAATALDFTLTPSTGGGAMSADEAKAMEAKRKELEGRYVAAVGMLDAGQVDEGIAALKLLMAETGGCAVCEVKIGDALWKKNDEAGAEAAYKRAIAADAKMADAYAQLANLYNQQKKFDQASEMSKKANELAGAGAAGGGNASVVFNQGIIFWNQSKIPEAKAQFEQAIKIDPNLAEAHYWLGMALVNEGDLPGSKASFEKYLSLAPTGQYADTAKGILASIK
jgi:tetratricopeptide (TPR) repeat protein